MDSSMIADEIKKKIIDRSENLDKVTDDIKEDVESNIEGDSFSVTKYQQYMRERESIVVGAAKHLGNTIDDAHDAWSSVKSREDEDQFKRHKDGDTIDSDDYNQLRKAAVKYKRLYSNFAFLWYADEKAIDNLEGAIDQQAQLKQAQDLSDKLSEVMESQEDLGKKISQGITSGSVKLQIDDIKESVKEEVEEEVDPGVSDELLDRLDSLENENERLREKVEELEDRQKEKEDSEKGELTEKQQSLLELARESPGMHGEELAEEAGYPYQVAVQQAGNIREKGYEFPEEALNE